MTTIPAEKLDKLVSRWQAIQGELASGADAESYAQLSKEFSDLDPIVGTITVFVLPANANSYDVHGVYTSGETAASVLLAGFTVDVEACFAEAENF